MDENDFYRQATLRICGNLEIEEALASSLNFLRQEMPVDRIYLQFQDVNLNALRIIAMATPQKAMKVDLLTPLSSEALQEQMDLVEEYRQQGKPNLIWLFNDNPKKNAAIREVFELHRMKVTSLMIIPLKATGKVLGGGSLVLTTEGNRKFTQKHADLISMLREPFSITMSNALRYQEISKLKDLLADDNRYLQGELRNLAGDEIIGTNFGLRDVMHKVQQVAALDSPVLLLGETGVGKDVIANTIHYSSSRNNGPFVTVNCGAIPDTLIDSELFGHEKGAFTGALSQKRGRFERANKGTIFLDEIGELPLQAQVRLLKVLESKEIERVGGVKTISLDIRIIAATNRDLEKMVISGDFRKDLWFRLNVFPIIIPPLRERKHDIVALLQHFIALKTRELKLPRIPEVVPGSMDILMSYNWPGNVRELSNLVERAMILNPTGLLDFTHLISSRVGASTGPILEASSKKNLDKIISNHIQNVVMETNGKIHGPGGAAEILGVNPSSLRNKMNKYGIKYGRRFETQI